MIVDIPAAIASLAGRRPLFHSEADFQHALGWELHSRLPSMDLRLELPLDTVAGILHVDLWLSSPRGCVAVELKYKTRGMTVRIGDERFSLKNQSAQDIGRYDYLRDLSRVERIVQDHKACEGWAILLTNDPSYWKSANVGGTVDAQFRIHQGRSLSGTLAWGANAAPGTVRGREEPIPLGRAYETLWRNYAEVPHPSYGAFRYLALSVV